MLKETTSNSGGETVNNYWPGGQYGAVPYGYGNYGGYPNGGGWNLGNLLGGGTLNFNGGGKALGVIGTVLGAVAVGVPLLRAAFYGAPFGGGAPFTAAVGPAPYGCCDGGYVTHKELALVREIGEERSKNAALLAQTYTDRTAEIINSRITKAESDQALVNCATANNLGSLNRQAREVQRMTMRILKPTSLATSQAVLTAFNNRLDALAEARGATPDTADEEPVEGA